MQAVERKCKSNAAEFVKANQAEVEKASVMLMQATHALVETLCVKLFRKGEMETIRKALANKQLYKVFMFVRSHADRLRKEDSNDIYWEWVDAYGFFHDAVDVSWPHITLERRAIALQTSIDMARKVMDRSSYEPALAKLRA